ncbi:MAG: phosphodiester glycosidase family protein [Clostridia bacterium]|nr:phosphodiester glycosidase family protein [Clostridia bacterium]
MAKKRERQRRHVFRNTIITLLILGCVYSFLVYTDMPFIAKWRTIYIETAMTTFTHKWLATAFIPKQVIAETMGYAAEVESKQESMSTNSYWHISKEDLETVFTLSGKKDDGKKFSKKNPDFAKVYPEIDIDTLDAYMSEHEDEAYVDGCLWIDAADTADEDTGIRTTAGDRVLAIDTKNGIVIIMRRTSDFVARMAIIKNPDRVSVAASPNYGRSGAKIADICKSSDAVLGINASGFDDPDGKGNGAVSYGLLISDGTKRTQAAGGTYKMTGFDYSDTLLIGSYSDTSVFRDAVEFKPILVLDGKRAVEGSAGWGVQPRSAIGQTANGEVLLLIVDGRSPGYSIGATMEEIAELMLEYNVYQAINLDGGSSSVMYYNGRIITKPSAGDKANGRLLPDAFVVKAAS